MDAVLHRFRAVRSQTEALCEPLQAEDYVVQSMPDVSPTKWHIAHVTWFFETFVLCPHLPGYKVFHADFAVLFNSYYNGVGEQFKRAKRGLLSRPTVAEVMAYRAHVDAAMETLILDGLTAEVSEFVELGLQHEQQHQELLLMDIKHVFFQNPLYPAYCTTSPTTGPRPSAYSWLEIPADSITVGHQGAGFGYDNESPAHTVALEDFAISDRLVTNGEYLEFIEDGGYASPLIWLADGWAAIQEKGWQAPLYWVKRDSEWFEFTLHGLQPLDRNAPVSHISYYEADAFASWARHRLPTEFEWEAAARSVDQPKASSMGYHPGFGGLEWFGQLWQWTASAYMPYPGFQAAEGAIGEYNGKFMCNQMVMRGSACITPVGHARESYRNFFYPHMRWQFGGIRLVQQGR